MRVAGTVPAAVRTLSRAMDPTQLFRRIQHDPYPVLLQSGGMEGDANRYSVVASDPFRVLRFQEGRGFLKSLRHEAPLDGDPFTAIRESLDAFPVGGIAEVPFAGGAIGYLAYGLGRNREHGGRPVPPWGGPDLHLAFYDRGFVVDHVKGLTHLVSTGYPESALSRRIEKQRLDLERLWRTAASPPGREASVGVPTSLPPQFRTPRPEYLRAIRRAQDYLSAGEIYQVNLSHRIDVDGDWPPFLLYRRLMEDHPAQFGAYLPLEGHHVLCASPERLVQLQGKRAETRPIKGTRKRAADAGDDFRVARELPEAPKERAENVMIVDLARNDLGRVCVPGTVKAEEVCRVETLPTVHHLVSTVSGQLRSDCDGVDLIRALFPGGSMTGAPKIRAMEIIDELETVDRGIYAGSVGYFSLAGDLDWNIVIRSVILRGATARLQVGGAILAESEPEAEYEETLDKARPILDLLQSWKRS